MASATPAMLTSPSFSGSSRRISSGGASCIKENPMILLPSLRKRGKI